MVKSELLRVLKEQCPDLQASDVELALNCLLEHLISGLASGERIEIRGFGSFTLRHQPARLSRNPKTGEAVKVRLHFKPGKKLRDRVNDARSKFRITE